MAMRYAVAVAGAGSTVVPETVVSMPRVQPVDEDGTEAAQPLVARLVAVATGPVVVPVIAAVAPVAVVPPLVAVTAPHVEVSPMPEIGPDDLGRIGVRAGGPAVAMPGGGHRWNREQRGDDGGDQQGMSFHRGDSYREIRVQEYTTRAEPPLNRPQRGRQSRFGPVSTRR